MTNWNTGVFLALLGYAATGVADQRLVIAFDAAGHRLVQVADLQYLGEGRSREAGNGNAQLTWSGPDGPGALWLADPRLLRVPAQPGQSGHPDPVWRASGLYSVVVPDAADLDTLHISLPAATGSGPGTRQPIRR